MDTPSADLLKNSLTLFAQSVSETARQLAVPADPGLWYASAPFYEKCRVRELLDSAILTLEETAVLEREYLRIVQELNGLFNKGGNVYRDLLLAELKEQVHAYHAEMCFISLSCDRGSAGACVSRRELIGELLLQLRNHYSLSALEALIATIDENVIVTENAVPDKVFSEKLRPEKFLSESCSCNDPHRCGGSKHCARQI